MKRQHSINTDLGRLNDWEELTIPSLSFYFVVSLKAKLAVWWRRGGTVRGGHVTYRGLKLITMRQCSDTCHQLAAF